MLILITGATGYLGIKISNYLLDKGFSVAGTYRTKKPDDSRIQWIQYHHGQELNVFHDKKFDTILHLAYDFGSNDIQKNVEADKRIIDYFKSTEVFQIYMSSYSAHILNPSLYGQSKMIVEVYCKEKGVSIIRPGLVFGKGGNAEKMLKMGNLFMVMPIIDNGNQQIAMIHYTDLNEIILKIITDKKCIEGNFYIQPRPTLKKLFKIYSYKKRLIRFYISLPTSYIKVFLPFLNFIGIKISRDSLLGLNYNSNIKRQSQLKDYVQNPVGIDDCIDSVI